MATRGFLVEFFGMPGVGKSTVSHRIAVELARRGHCVREPSYVLAHGPAPLQRRLRKSVEVARELVLHPLASLRAAWSMAGTQQPDLGTRVKVLFNWLLIVASARTARRRRGCHLFDQGLLQAVWSVAYAGPEDAPLPLLTSPLARAGLPDVVVLIVADLDQVQDRLAHRPARDCRLQRPDVDRATLARAERLVQRIRASAERIPGLELIEVHNDGTAIDRIAGVVADRLAVRAQAAAAIDARARWELGT